MGLFIKKALCYLPYYAAVNIVYGLVFAGVLLRDREMIGAVDGVLFLGQILLLLLPVLLIVWRYRIDLVGRWQWGLAAGFACGYLFKQVSLGDYAILLPFVDFYLPETDWARAAMHCVAGLSDGAGPVFCMVTLALLAMAVGRRKMAGQI